MSVPVEDLFTTDAAVPCGQVMPSPTAPATGAACVVQLHSGWPLQLHFADAAGTGAAEGDPLPVSSIVLHETYARTSSAATSHCKTALPARCGILTLNGMTTPTSDA